MPNPEGATKTRLNTLSASDGDHISIAGISADVTFTSLLHRLAAEHAREVDDLRAQLVLARSTPSNILNASESNGQVIALRTSCDPACNHHSRKESHAPLPLPVVMCESSDMVDDYSIHEIADGISKSASCPQVGQPSRNKQKWLSSSRSTNGTKKVSISPMGSDQSETNSAEMERRIVSLRPSSATSDEAVRSSTLLDPSMSSTTFATRASRAEKQVVEILGDKGDTFETASIARKNVDSPWIESFISFIIILNIVQMGVSSDVSPAWDGWIMIDSAFAVFFLTEMLTKIYFTGFRHHFTPAGETWLWNWFDFMIVLMAFVDVGVALLMEDRRDDTGGAFNLSLLRTVRLLRLARLTRLLRAPIFRELKMMFMGLFLGARTLFWSFMLVITPLYPVAIILRETLGNSIESGDLKREFASVTDSWFTIFRCVMGDCSDENGKPIFLQVARQEGWAYAAFYIIVVVATVFGLFNVVTAIYVENFVSAQKQIDYLARRRRLQDTRLKDRLTKKLVKQFTEAAHQCTSGLKTTPARLNDMKSLIITEEIFEEVMNENEEVDELLTRLDVAEEDRLDLFEILDADGSGGLDVHELVNGILKLRGGARRSDVVACRLLLHSLQDSVESVVQRLTSLTAFHTSLGQDSEQQSSSNFEKKDLSELEVIRTRSDGGARLNRKLRMKLPCGLGAGTSDPPERDFTAISTW